MNTGAKYTKAFFVVALLVISAYDALAVSLWGVDATISRVVGVEASFDSPFIPFGMGVVMGHLFWAQPRSKRGESNQIQ